MAAEGVWAKQDGDIWYASDVNESQAWHMRVMNAFIGGSVPVGAIPYTSPNFFDNAFFHGIRDPENRLGSPLFNVTPGSLVLQFNVADLYPHLVQFARPYSLFSGAALVATEWVSGIVTAGNAITVGAGTVGSAVILIEAANAGSALFVVYGFRCFQVQPMPPMCLQRWVVQAYC